MYLRRFRKDLPNTARCCLISYLRDTALVEGSVSVERQTEPLPHRSVYGQ